MIYTSKTEELFFTNETIGKDGIRQDTFSVLGLTPESVSFSDLYSHKGVEISMIISGFGMHRVMEQTIPCGVGDVYILNANIPHRYYTSEEGIPLVVQRILFLPKDWLDGDLGDASTSNYCFGIFKENATAAYAMLTKGAFDKLQSLCDLLAVELLEKKGDWHSAVRSYLSLIVIAFKRYVNRAIKNIPSESTQAEWSQISLVTQALAERYADEKETVTAGTVNDIFDYKSVGEDCSKIFVYSHYGSLKMIIVFAD